MTSEMDVSIQHRLLLLLMLMLCLLAILMSCSSSLRGGANDFQNCHLRVSQAIFDAKLVTSSHENALDILEPFVALILVNASTAAEPTSLIAIADYGDNSTLDEIHLSLASCCSGDCNSFISTIGTPEFGNGSMNAGFDYNEQDVSLETCLVAAISHTYYSYGNKRVRFEITTSECRQVRSSGHIIEKSIKAKTLEETIGNISFIRQPSPKVPKVTDRLTFFIGLQRALSSIQCIIFIDISKIKILLKNGSETLPDWVPPLNRDYFKGIYVHTFNKSGLHSFKLQLRAINSDSETFSVHRVINISVIDNNTPHLTLHHKQLNESSCHDVLVYVPLHIEFQNIFKSFLNKTTTNCNVIGNGIHLISDQETATDMFEEVHFLILYNESYGNLTVLIDFGDRSPSAVVTIADTVFSAKEFLIWDNTCDIRLNYGLIRHSYSVISGNFEIKLAILNSSTGEFDSRDILTANASVKSIKESVQQVAIRVDTNAETNGDSVVTVFIRKLVSFMMIFLSTANGSITTELNNMRNQKSTANESINAIISKEFSDFSYMAVTPISFYKSGCLPLCVNVTTPSGLESYAATKYVYIERANIPLLRIAAIVYDDSVNEYPDARENVNFLVAAQTTEGLNYAVDFGDGSIVVITFLSNITLPYWIASSYFQMAASNGYSMALLSHSFLHAGRYTVSLTVLLSPEKSSLICQTSIDVQGFTSKIEQLVVRVDPIGKTVLQGDYVLVIVAFQPTHKATSINIYFGDSCQTALQLTNSSSKEYSIDTNAQEEVWGFWHAYKMAGTFNLTVQIDFDGLSTQSIAKTIALEIKALEIEVGMHIFRDLNIGITQYSSTNFVLLMTRLLPPTADICVDFGDGRLLKYANMDSVHELPSWVSDHVVRFDVYRLVVGHTFAFPGVYIIELTALRQSTSIRVSVNSFSKTVGRVVLLPLNATNGGEPSHEIASIFAIFMENIVDELTIVVDFGDSFVRPNSTVNEMLTDYTHLFSSQSRYRYAGLVEHLYTADGSFEVSVTVGSYMAWPFGCLRVSYSHTHMQTEMCKKPSVDIFCRRCDLSKNNTFERGAEVHLHAVLETNCSTQRQVYFNYLWSVTKAQNESQNCLINLGNQDSNTLLKKECCNSDLRLPAFSLEFGFYCITIEVIEQTKPNNGLADAFVSAVYNSTIVKIIPSPIIARINSLFSIDSVYDFTSTIILTANSSYDPNEVNGATSELTFYWKCIHVNDTIEDIDRLLEMMSVDNELECIESHSTFLYVDNTSSSLTLKTTELKFVSLPTDYYFYVNVSRENYSSVSPPFKVHLVQGSPPTVFVECKANCDYTRNSKENVRLQYTCENCLERETLVSTWHLAYILDSHQSIRIDASQNETINIDDKTVEFPSEVIYSRNRSQIATVVTVTVTRKDETSSEAVLLLATNSSSVDWESKDGPLKTGALTSKGLLRINVRFLHRLQTFLLLFSVKAICGFGQ